MNFYRVNKKEIQFVWLFFISFSFGCTVQRNFEIYIHVKRPSGESVPRARIVKDGKAVGLSDVDGNLSITVTTNCENKIKISAQKDEIESQEPILLPIEINWTCPDFMQGILAKADVNIQLELPAALENSMAKKSEKNESEKSESEKNSTPTPVTESDLPLDEIADLQSTPVELKELPSKIKNELNQNEEKINSSDKKVTNSDTSKIKLDMPFEKPAEIPAPIGKNKLPLLVESAGINAKHLVLNVYSKLTDKKIPLPDTEVFMGRNFTRTEKLLGKTDQNGRLEVSVPQNLWGESLIFKNVCCGIRSQAITSGRDGANQEFIFPEKKGREFHAIHFAYGLSRGAEKVEVKWGASTQDVTGPTGLAVVNENSGDLKFSLASQDYLPAQVSISNSENSNRFYLAPRRAIKPIVALLELENEIQGKTVNQWSDDSVFRLFRREFLAKYLQSMAVRPVIGAETRKLAKNAGIEIEHLILKGWQNTALEAEWDAMLILRKLDAFQGQKSLILRLVNRMGVEMWKKNISFDGKAGQAEAQAANSFNDFMKSFPFEATVIKNEGGEIILAHGEQDERFLNIGDTFAIYLGATVTDIPTTWKGKIKVNKIGRNESRAAWLDGASKSVLNSGDLIGARAVRILSGSESFSTKLPKLK